MKRLRELREARSMSQQKLAMKLNITQAAVSKYELGLSEPDFKMLKNMAKLFNVSIDYLIEFSDNPIISSTSDFSRDELEVINKFRELSDIQKLMLHAYLKGLLQE